VDLRVVRTDDAELPVVSSILLEASRWLSEHTGHPMWEPHELTVEALLADYERDDIHLAWSGDEPVATVFLLGRDTTFWPESPPGEAAFIHKLAVRRAWAGRGVPERLVDWAAGTARARGARFLRLDCDAEREKLLAFYERLGFRCVRRGVVRTFATCFYERHIAPEA
jgi:GNAT superfamily N-acetyltransferase